MATNSRSASTCGYCGKSFNHPSSLSRHIKTIHGVHQHKATIHCNEDECNFKCSRLNDLRDHLCEEHDLEVQTETKSFGSRTDFMKWKESEEKQTDSWFVKQCGGRKAKNGSTIIRYYCNRTGKFKSRGSQHRQLKSQGTSKTNSHCPASMVASENQDGSINIVYSKTHHGHSCDVAHIRLSASEKMDIAAKLHSKISMDAILDDIRESVQGPMKRVHYTTRKDIQNISHAFGLNGFLHDIEDSRSVKLWVEEMKDKPIYENPVLLYKAQGEEQPATLNNIGKDDFVLGIMTPHMKHMLKEFGDGKIVCMDATHGTNEHKFQLITVLVIDEFGEGVPAAWLISNREDKAVLIEFIKAIKERTGDISAKYIMTDDAPQYFAAWTAVFGAGPTKLLCAWHVHRSWRNLLQQKIKDKQLQAATYKSLVVVMEEQDQTHANTLLKLVVDELLAADTTHSFGESFSKTYANRMEEWALSGRLGAGINTNMYLEAFFNVLKTSYLDSRANRRIDKLVATLLRVAKDKLFQRLRKLKKGKWTFRTNIIRNRHQSSLKLAPSKVSPGSKSNEWKVGGDDNREYDVIKNESVQQPCCHVKCNTCNVCIHMMSCTCMDAVIQTTLCKHIHLVCRSAISSSNPAPHPMGTDVHSQQIPSTASQKSTPDQINERLKYKLGELLEKTKQVTNAGILRDTEKTIDKLLKFVEIQVPNIDLPQAIARTPANKKMTTQRFHATIKKRKRKPLDLTKPTQRERSKISSRLLAGHSILTSDTAKKTRAEQILSRSISRKYAQNRLGVKFRRTKQNPATALQRKIKYRVSGGAKFSWGPKYRRIANLLHSVAKPTEVKNAILGKLMTETSLMSKMDMLALKISEQDIKDMSVFFTSSGQTALRSAVAEFQKLWKCASCTVVKDADMIECSKCRMWYHWSCAGVYRRPKGSWHCTKCSNTYRCHCMDKPKCRSTCRCKCHKQKLQKNSNECSNPIRSDCTSTRQTSRSHLKRMPRVKSSSNKRKLPKKKKGVTFSENIEYSSTSGNMNQSVHKKMTTRSILKRSGSSTDILVHDVKMNQTSHSPMTTRSTLKRRSSSAMIVDTSGNMNQSVHKKMTTRSILKRSGSSTDILVHDVKMNQTSHSPMTTRSTLKRRRSSAMIVEHSQHTLKGRNKGSKRAKIRRTIDVKSNETSREEVTSEDELPSVNIQSGQGTPYNPPRAKQWSMDELVALRAKEKEKAQKTTSKRRLIKNDMKGEQRKNKWQRLITDISDNRDFTSPSVCNQSLEDLLDNSDEKDKLLKLAECIWDKCFPIVEQATKTPLPKLTSDDNLLVKYGNGYRQFVPESVWLAGHTPLQVSTEENMCLYNSISKLIVGLEPELIHLVVAASAIIHKDEVIKSLEIKYPSLNEAMMWATESSDQYTGNEWSDPHVIITDVVEKEIMKTLTRGNDSGKVQMIFIARALQQPIDVVTIDPARTNFRIDPPQDTQKSKQCHRKQLTLLLVPTKPTNYTDIASARYSHFVPVYPSKYPLQDGSCGAKYFDMCLSDDTRNMTTCKDCKINYHEKCVEQPKQTDSFQCGCAKTQPQSFKWFMQSDDAKPVNIFLSSDVQEIWESMKSGVITSQRYNMFQRQQDYSKNTRERVLKHRGIAYLPCEEGDEASYDAIVDHIYSSILEKDIPSTSRQSHHVYSDESKYDSFTYRTRAGRMVNVLFPEVLAKYLREKEGLNRMEIEHLFQQTWINENRPNS